MNINLHYCRLVDSIVKEGTLTRAAVRLHLTQSALSHQLKELEVELGVSVFERKGKRLHLTDEGHRFLQSAEKILDELKMLEADMQLFKDGDSGTIRISTQCYTAYHWLPKIIKYYEKINPGIDIHIVSGATHLPLDYLVRGELDVAIVRNRIDHPHIRYEPIFKDHLYIIFSAEHPLAKKENISIHDFEGEELFLQYNDPSSGNIPIIENLLKVNQVKPKHIHRIHYTDAIIEMVNANMGLSVLADWILNPYLQTKAIVARPLPSELSTRTWFAATCRQNKPIRNFLDCLKYQFAEITMQPVHDLRVPISQAV